MQREYEKIELNNSKLVQDRAILFESLGTVSHSHLVATMAVSLAICEIFSVKDLENSVRGCSRLLRMAPFNRPYTTFYWSAIVNIALSCTNFELFNVE